MQSPAHQTGLPAVTARAERPRPAVALVGNLAEARWLWLKGLHSEAWELVQSALAIRPFHPEAFLLLAEIARATGEATLAERCARHATRLAPAWEPPRAFLRQPRLGVVLPQPLSPPMALYAHPSRLRLTVCLIARDEAEMLGRCLNSVRGLADQVVVVDTGSRDQTAAIATELGAEVYPFTWCDDFSAARNASLEPARGDWVLVLDADEELPIESRALLRQAMETSSVIAWRLPLVEVGREEEGCHYVPRLFRNAPGLCFVGRVHEQVFGSLEPLRREWGLENRLGCATLLHYGYTRERVRDRGKVQRNLRLLERAVEELPNDPMLLMNYGLELVHSGQLAAGLARYRQAFQLISSRPPEEVAPELREAFLVQFASQLMAHQAYGEMIAVLTSPLARAGGLSASLHFSLGLAHLQLGQFEESAGQIVACLAKAGQPALAAVNPEIRRAGPHHVLALCLARMDRPAEAELAFERAMEAGRGSRAVRLDYAWFLASRQQPVRALQLLHGLVAEHPQDPAAWVEGARIALTRMELLDFALDWTGEAIRLVPDHDGLARQRAEALLLTGRCAEALPLWSAFRPVTPQTRAAAILCGLAAGREVEPPTPDLELAVSHEFLKWYQRLVGTVKTETPGQIHARLATLQDCLPSASRVLHGELARGNPAALPNPA